MNLKKLSLLYTKVTKEGVLLLQDFIEVAHSIKNMPQMAESKLIFFIIVIQK